MFKKLVGAAITTAPLDYDVITLTHDYNNAQTPRYIGYSNVGNKPEIKAYDTLIQQINGNGVIGDNGTAGTIRALGVDGNGFLTVQLNGVLTDNLEVMRFQQNDLTPQLPQVLNLSKWSGQTRSLSEASRMTEPTLLMYWISRFLVERYLLPHKIPQQFWQNHRIT